VTLAEERHIEDAVWQIRHGHSLSAQSILEKMLVDGKLVHDTVPRMTPKLSSIRNDQEGDSYA
jgi:hypothetical protein